MKLSQTEINLYGELQSIFPKDWEVGDRVYHLEKDEYRFFCHEAYPDLLFQTGHGEVLISHGDIGLFSIRIPLPIDPGDPDRISRGERPRGLWHMLCRPSIVTDVYGKEEYYICYTRSTMHGSMAQRENNRHVWFESDNIGGSNTACGATPIEALLKALKAQMRLKMK